MNDPKELVDRYVAVWNEPDPGGRRRAIAELWTEDGTQILQPPEEIREAAVSLGVSPTLRARGHDELETRVARAYEQFVAPGEFVFRPRGNPSRLDDVVKFGWEMVAKETGEVAGAGLEFVVLEGDGRIRTDYQFIEG